MQEIARLGELKQKGLLREEEFQKNNKIIVSPIIIHMYRKYQVSTNQYLAAGTR
jgi:hypothetical protein